MTIEGLTKSMKKFILMTTGRAGSTAIMDVLEKHDDIAVPNKQIDCRDNELLNPTTIERIAEFYRRATGATIDSDLTLIDAFFTGNARAAYAGFKSMPNRHRNLQALTETPDIQFITLHRQDLAATVASFIVAIDHGTWRRDGGTQTHRFAFGPEFEKRALGHLSYLLASLKVIERIPNAIRLTYEEICSPTFSSQALDAFFGREIKLDTPQPPTDAAHYVDNWHRFSEFIARHLGRMAGPA